MSCYYDLHECHKGMRATLAPVPCEIYEVSDRGKHTAGSRLCHCPYYTTLVRTT